MRCEEAQRLFDSYLDGELPSSLLHELDAHRLRCGPCRRALAIHEVAGHILASDQQPVALREDFTSRLLACVDTGARTRWEKVRRFLYVAGPLAAAAVIALAFLGAFDRGRESKVAGVKVEPIVQPSGPVSGRSAVVAPDPYDAAASQRAIEQWIDQTRKNLAVKRQSGESLQQALDLTILQLLDILEEANDRAAYPPYFPGADEEVPFPPPDRADEDDDVEDL